jgi:sec-independent protein translocase protein TatB
MFNIGSGEMIVIFLLALLVLGPERLPKAMGQVGRAVAQMRKLSGGFQDEIRRAMDPIEAPFRPGEETLHGPVPAITDEVRVVATADPEPDPEPAVSLEKADADDEVAVEPATRAPVVDDDVAPRGTVTPLRPRVEPASGDGDDRATG